MKNIAIYGKSISENNLKFLEALIVTLKDELNPQLFIHQSLEDHSSLIERFNFNFFDGQDLLSNGILDSLDIVILATKIKKTYNINIKINSQKIINLFRSYNELLKFIKKNSKNEK